MQQVKKQDHELPFITTTTTPRGRYLSMNFFDVPAQSYGDGWPTGMEAAAQFMDALRDNPKRDFAIRVLEEVAKAVAERGSGESRRGAAVGFLRMIEAMLRTVAKTHDCGRWIREQRELQELQSAEFREYEREMRKTRTAEFVARMKAAKQAKRHAAEAREVCA